jgi:hypothetical protein
MHDPPTLHDLPAVDPDAYPAEEHLACLRRAFVDRGADYVYVDSRRNRFLLSNANWGLREGYLEFDAVTSADRSDEQYTCLVLRLTAKGREALKAPAPAS